MFIKESRTASNIAMSYIGAVVGAGFISGQENLKFFLPFGINGILGTLMAGILFGAIGSIILQISYRLRVSSYRDLIIHVMGRRLSAVIDLALIFFLMGTLGVMLAGAGELFKAEFAFMEIIGVLFTVASLIIALSYGLDSILWINRRLVPLLICIGPLVAAIAIWNWPGVAQVQSNLNYDKFHLLPGACTLSVLLYVSYNLLLSLSFLAALGGEVQGEKAAISGGWIGGIILGFMAGMNQLAIHLYKREIAGSEFPMLLLAGNYSSLLQGLYIFTLWAAIFTTALSNLYGLSRRLGDMIGCDWRSTVGPLLGIGILLSRVGFSNLIGIVYPIFGYIGLSFIIMVIVKSPMRERHLWFFFHRRD